MYHILWVTYQIKYILLEMNLDCNIFHYQMQFQIDLSVLNLFTWT